LPTQAPPEVTLFVRLLRANATLRRELEVRLLQTHSLTVSDYEALLVLAREEEGSMRRVDLAGRLLLTPSGVTRLLDGLQKLGYVGKRSCAADARVTYAVITDAGRKTLHQAVDVYHTALADLLGERLSPDEVETLGTLLGRLPGAADDEPCALDDE
jgi:DNA-binding MarR family transcriptional regulator